VTHNYPATPTRIKGQDPRWARIMTPNNSNAAAKQLGNKTQTILLEKQKTTIV